MPRPSLPVGSWGRITRTEVSAKKWRARARFRDFSGRTKLVEAWGRSGAEAQRRLEAELRDRADAGGGHDIVGGMRLGTLGELWIEECRQSELTPQSVDRYQDTVEKIIVPGLGGLQIREATVSRIDRFLKETAARTPAQARQARVALSGMMNMATRHGACRSNPVRDTRLPKATRRPVRAMTLEELAALRRGVKLWQESGHMGPPRCADLLDVVDVLLATGCRIGELCALRWSDVDLSASPATATFAGTVVRIAGQGLIRQATPKTAAGHRTVTLPRFAVTTLIRRQVNAQPNALDLVFPSSVGSLRDPHNLRRQWRDARAAAGFSWTTPHSLRKTTATWIDRQSGTKDAAAVLGHAGVAITERFYVERAAVAPDMSTVLQALGGPSGDENDGFSAEKGG